ncbi:hypothetical protein AB0F81_51070, partial [Actinoplanes sp. NPDC024001]|uniref:hypothetical protein n=1 Tax=Actinoplanes sp. NPDC024001 TaxID=3154598 RepID=UPI0033ED1AAD
MTILLLLLLAYTGLGGIVAADGRPWVAVPLCLIAFAAIGELWVRAFTGPRGPRPGTGLGALAGLVTLPLVALAVHAAGAPVRLIPLVAGAAV